jgi:hypothetical protein
MRLFARCMCFWKLCHTWNEMRRIYWHTTKHRSSNTNITMIRLIRCATYHHVFCGDPVVSVFAVCALIPGNPVIPRATLKRDCKKESLWPCSRQQFFLHSLISLCFFFLYVFCHFISLYLSFLFISVSYFPFVYRFLIVFFLHLESVSTVESTDRVIIINGTVAQTL